ncbi:neuroblast differentiation-associated protein AHNAK-like, partial [Scleropages formosus]
VYSAPVKTCEGSDKDGAQLKARGSVRGGCCSKGAPRPRRGTTHRPPGPLSRTATMCDCFHLAFPNWHGSPGTAGGSKTSTDAGRAAAAGPLTRRVRHCSAAPASCSEWGPGRRLKGPESAAEDDSFLEGERPRPQGSSPVNEYPVNEKYSEKQAEEEIYDPYQKSGSTKKGKWEMEDIESGVIVKAVKEAGAEGLVVRGGGKEGIFVKEVKPESPASKQLGVKEGDQILSATVYFDDVSYEDALQILEHAQACKMELCLKRKTPSTQSTLERSTDTHLEMISGEEGASPVERGRRKTQRRHEARISWPKFPSFSRGRKAYFKRSHSTSEAEEEKLQMSPTTSDTESPIKTQEDAKDKTKRQKVKVSKGKMSLRSKSADQNENLAVEAALGFVEKKETLEETSDLQSPEPQERIEKPQEKVSDYKGSGYSKALDVGIKDSSLNIDDSDLSAETNTDDFKGKFDTSISPKFKVPKMDLKDFSVHEPIAKTETDITHVERKEPKVKIKVPNTDQQILAEKIEKKIHLPKREDIEIPGMEATESKGILPLSALKMTVDIHMQKAGVDDVKGVSPKTDLSTVKLPKIDLPDLDTHQHITKKDITAEKVKLKDAADIPKPKTPEMITKQQDVSAITPQTVPNTASSYDMGDKTEGKIKAFEMPKQTENYSIAELTKRSAPTFKLPKPKFPDADSHEPILMTKLESSEVNAEILGPKGEVNIQKEREGEKIRIEQLKVNRPEIRMKLPNREDFEIPGREAKIASTDSIGSLAIKHPQTGEVIVPATGNTEMQKLQADISANAIKDTDFKISVSAMKLPKVEFSGPDRDQQITKTDVNVGKKADLKNEISNTDVQDKELVAQVKKGKFKVPQMPYDDISIPTLKSEIKVQKPGNEVRPDITTTKSVEAKTPEAQAKQTQSKAQDVTVKMERTDLKYTVKESSFVISKPELKLPEVSDTEMKISDVSDNAEPSKHQMTISRKTVDIKKDKAESEGLKKDMDSENKGDLFEKLSKVKTEMQEVGAKPDVKGPKLSGDFSLPSVNVSLTKPDAGIAVPTVSVDGSSADVELPGTQFKVSGQTPSLDIQGSSVDIEGPGVDVDMQGKGADLQGQGSKFKMAKFGISMPKVKGPEVDISISKPGVDISLPKAQATAQLPSVDVEVPSAEGQAELPEADIKDIDVKLKKPKVSFPKFGFSKDGKAPEVDVSLSKGEVPVPEGSVEIKSPEIDGKADAEVGGSPSKFKLPHFKLPKFGASAPKGKAELTDVQVDVKVPEIEAPSGKVGMEVKAPGIDIDRPDVELDKTTAE